ncbi:MAG: glycosyltransferase [Deltaproteobacteria bacterium]|nr:glycosyltransferase [Deltaproteobacteria bacterium]
MQTERAPLIFLLPSLAGGGAERVAATLAPRLDLHFDLTLALLQNRCDFPLPGSVRKTFFSGPLLSAPANLVRFPYHVFSLVKLVRRSRALTVLSFMEQANIINVLAAQMTGHRAILSQRTNPKEQYLGKGVLGAAIVRSCASLYPRCHRLIAVSHRVGEVVVEDYGLRPEQVAVIANPVDIEKMRAMAGEEPPLRLPARFLLHVGRLDIATKRQDYLLSAFKEMLHEIADLSLVFVGVGPDREFLQARCCELGIAPKVIFAGWQENVAGFMSRALATVLCSRYEGWPNVLVEAMSVGCPVVATDCPTGPREIIGNSRYGLLVGQDDPAELVAACLSLFREPTRMHLASQAALRARDYALDTIVDRYRRVLQ